MQTVYFTRTNRKERKMILRLRWKQTSEWEVSPEEVAAVDGTMGTAQEQPAGQPLTRHGGVFVCVCAI